MLPKPELPEEALDALGNSERRRLLVLLADGPKSVGELAGAFAISRPAVSRHLRLLTDARLVRYESVGTRNLYSLDRTGLAATTAWLDGFWDEAEARLRLLAENTSEKTDGR
jgi:DNA-binding transcriptional ArsR family regulator